MSEIISSSPLEDAMALHDEAKDIDQQLVIYSDIIDDNNEQRIEQNLEVLTAKHPWEDRMVTVTGRELTRHEHERGGVRALSDNEKQTTIRGQFYKYLLCKVYDFEDEEFNYRVAYQLIHANTAFKISMEDTMYDITIGQRMATSLICVDDSKVSPIIPIDAHSLVDLDNDHVKHGIDEAIAAKNESRYDLFRRLASLTRSDPLVAATLNSLTGHSHVDRNIQRVSYLNAQRILETIKHVTSNGIVILGKKENHMPEGSFLEIQSVQGQRHKKPYKVIPDYFDIQPAYLLSDDGSQVESYTSELYVAGHLKNGTAVHAPVRSVIDVVS